MHHFPPLVAMMAAGMSDVDEREPRKAFRDRRGDCPACCRRVNLQRTIVLVFFVTSLATMVYCALR